MRTKPGLRSCWLAIVTSTGTGQPPRPPTQLGTTMTPTQTQPNGAVICTRKMGTLVFLTAVCRRPRPRTCAEGFVLLAVTKRVAVIRSNFGSPAIGTQFSFISQRPSGAVLTPEGSGFSLHLKIAEA